MFLQVRFHHPGCVLSVGHDTAEEKAEKCFEGEEEEEMWAPHWAWKGRVVTIHSEPSSCQTRGWSRHPAPPQLMNDENHTRGWSHSCQLQWGYPKEKAHKNQAENMMCLQVITVKVLNQTDPMSSSSSSPHSVNQSKTKPGFSTCHSILWQCISVKFSFRLSGHDQKWGGGHPGDNGHCCCHVWATKSHSSTQRARPREGIPEKTASASHSALKTKMKARSILGRMS